MKNGRWNFHTEVCKYFCGYFLWTFMYFNFTGCWSYLHFVFNRHPLLFFAERRFNFLLNPACFYSSLLPKTGKTSNLSFIHQIRFSYLYIRHLLNRNNNNNNKKNNSKFSKFFIYEENVCKFIHSLVCYVNFGHCMVSGKHETCGKWVPLYRTVYCLIKLSVKVFLPKLSWLAR